MRQRQEVVARLALKYHAALVRFQRAFDAACARAPAEHWIWDGIHPTYSGHQVMADEWVRTVREFWPKAATPSGDPQTRRLAAYDGLPNLAQFQTDRCDRFLVDLQYINAGHPFKGRRARQPHQGAHIHWDNSQNAWPKGGVAVTNYPAIYAVADGYVDRIVYSFKVGTNDRYGLSIAFAKEKGTVYSFCYGIEPMIPEPAPDFYRQYILVFQGQRVREGDVLAYMYLPPGAGGGSHIHFHIQAHNGGMFLAPAIFSDRVVEDFHAHWDGFGRDGDSVMPACMGYLLEADENPFGTGAVDVLK
jgi:hypothetical protein